MSFDRSFDVSAMDFFAETEWPVDAFLRRAFYAGALSGSLARLEALGRNLARHDEPDDDEVIAWDPEYKVVRFVTRRGKWN